MHFWNLIPLLFYVSRYAVNAHPTNTIRSRDTDSSTELILSKVITALGGSDVLKNVSGVTYHSESIYRSQTLTQSYNLKHSDQSVAEDGAQNMSFRFPSGTRLQARIERFYQYNDYWIWAQPDLHPPMEYTVVMQDGSYGFACFTHGQNDFYSSNPSKAFGYADPYLTDYLIHQAHQFALPWLLQQFEHKRDRLVTTLETDALTNTTFRALKDPELGLTLMLNSTSYLPYIVRSNEWNPTLGWATSDLIHTNYSSVVVPGSPLRSILLPHRLQTFYDTAAGTKGTLEDVIIDNITINPAFSNNFFDGIPVSHSKNPPSPPKRSQEYPLAEVHAFFETGLWDGPFTFNVSTVVAQQPIPGFDKVHAVYIGYPDYVQLVVELEDGVIITDAPAHRSKILLQWVEQTLNKRVKYIVPSHHHRDHADGVGDYLAAGATLVVPEVAKDFYSQVDGGRFNITTYTEASPFAVGDRHVQFRSFWHEEAVHARDWTYAVASRACPAEDDPMVVFNADVWSPGTDGLRWDTGYARQWLDTAVQDGLPRSAVVVGAHGSGANGTTDYLETLIGITGYPYPNYTTKDWKTDDTIC